MRLTALRAGTLVAAATAAFAVPLTVAPPSQADTASPSAVITINKWNDCEVWSSDCDGDKDGTPVYFLEIDYNSTSYQYSNYAEMYGNISNYDYSEVPDQGTTYHFHYVFKQSGAPGTQPGAGTAVKNNAAAVKQCGFDSYRVYYNSGFAGHSQNFPWDNYCNKRVNLDSTLKNENASQHFS